MKYIWCDCESFIIITKNELVWVRFFWSDLQERDNFLLVAAYVVRREAVAVFGLGLRKIKREAVFSVF